MKIFVSLYLTIDHRECAKINVQLYNYYRFAQSKKIEDLSKEFCRDSNSLNIISS